MADRVEMVARAITRAAGVDPDVLVAPGTPALVPGGYVVPGRYAPAWQMFTAHAVSAIAAIDAPPDSSPAPSMLDKLEAGRVFLLSEKNGTIIISEDNDYYSKIDPSLDDLKRIGDALVILGTPIE